jgi:hypothetical protein
MGGEPMFGTVMIARSTAPVELMRSIVNDWAGTIGTAAGFVDERALVTEDGRVVVCVRFADRASYERLADDPAQSAWWESTLRPMLDDDPDWIDGTWHDL